MRSQRHGGLCGADCAYRRLYEGSQASLSDMSAKQAEALNRVARLRSGIVSSLKQTFPVQFGQAESQLSRRMSTTDDEVLLAYLNGFLALPTTTSVAAVTEPVGLGDLREELEALGVNLPSGGDLAQWAAAVASFSDTSLAAASTAPTTTAASVEPVAEPGPAAESATSARRRTGASSLLDNSSAGFDPGPVDPDAHEEVPWAAEPPPPYDDPTLEDVAPAVADTPPPPALAVDGDAHSLDDLFGDGGDLTSLFDDASEDPDKLVDALFTAGQDTSADAEEERKDAGTLTRAPATNETAGAHNAAAETFPAPPTTAGLAAQTTPHQPKESAGKQPPSQRSARGGGQALRPELFPAAQVPKGGKSSRRARTARVSAAPPDPRGLDVPIAEGATGGDLTEEMFSKLVASVCIPRPVFISDLVAQVGSAELVSAWEQRCRDMGTDSPVRFITPKPRHRDRGALIVPHSPELRKAASEFTRSWWATCLDERRLRGAKLYEVAVLLHRFGESVISSRIDGDVVVLRVNQARGLIGVAVALETDFAAGGSTRRQLADAVGELLGDRLTLVAVLTYSSGGGTLEKLAATVREESEVRGWRPTAPVIASLSWDFAADGGSSALSVL